MLEAFWLWYGLSAVLCVVLPEGRIFLGALGLVVVWALVLCFRAPLQALAGRLPGSPGVRFFLVGIIFSDLFMENLAVSFQGDLHHNLLINSFLWLGACIGYLSGWWLVSRRYQYTFQQVFFTAGSMGILVEQNWLVPKLLIKLQLFPVLVATPVLLVVYGTAVAPAFLLAPPGGCPAGKFGISAYSLGIGLPLALFLVAGQLWIALFRPLFV